MVEPAHRDYFVSMAAPTQECQECLTDHPTQLKSIEEEILKLQEEKKKYNETIHILGGLLQQEEGKISQLESRLSLTEKQKYREMRSLQDRLQYLHEMNTELSKNTALSLHKKHDLLHDVEELQKLLHEADRKCNEIEAMKSKYEDIQGVAYILPELHISAHLYQV